MLKEKPMPRLLTLFRSLFLLIALVAPFSAPLAQTVSIDAVTANEQDAGGVDFVFTVALF